MFALFERTREAIQQYPDDPDVRYLQALAMARLGDPHAALRIYERNRVERHRHRRRRCPEGPAAEGSRGSRRRSRTRSSCSGNRARRTNRPIACPTAIFPGSTPRRHPFSPAIRKRPASLRLRLASGRTLPTPTIFSLPPRAQKPCWSAARWSARRRCMRQPGTEPDASPGISPRPLGRSSLSPDISRCPDEQREQLLSAIRPSPVIHFCGHMFRAGWDQSSSSLPGPSNRSLTRRVR